MGDGKRKAESDAAREIRSYRVRTPWSQGPISARCPVPDGPSLVLSHASTGEARTSYLSPTTPPLPALAARAPTAPCLGGVQVHQCLIALMRWTPLCNTGGTNR